MFRMFDPTYLLYALPGLLLALWAQAKVKLTFARYSRVGARSGYTGAEAAHAITRRAGLGLDIQPIAGKLTDHYDPRKKVLRLSEPVYGGRSLAALGVAAHEAGHAIQDRDGYIPMKIRHGIYPVVAFGSYGWFILFFLGFMLASRGVVWGTTLALVGLALFAAIVAFQLVTLPVEYNASRRALKLLVSQGIVAEDEVRATRKVLSAAALTYLAAAVQSILILLYYLSLFSRRR